MANTISKVEFFKMCENEVNKDLPQIEVNFVSEYSELTNEDYSHYEFIYMKEGIDNKTLKDSPSKNCVQLLHNKKVVAYLCKVCFIFENEIYNDWETLVNLPNFDNHYQKVLEEDAHKFVHDTMSEDDYLNMYE